MTERRRQQKYSATKRWADKNRERLRAYSAEWRKNNPTANSEYRKQNREYFRKWAKENNEKCKAYCKKWHLRNPGSHRARHLMGLYGLTVAKFDEMLKAQNGVCALCFRPPRRGPLHVDHDHKTGKNRALLCTRCNRALGWFWDDPEKLEQAAAYIRKWRT